MTAIPPCRWCPTPGRVLLALGWAVFLGLTFGPVAGLFAEAAARLAAGEPEASAALVPSARQRALLGRSLALAGGVAVFAGLVGSLAALALLRRLAHGRGSRLLRAGLLAALVLWVVTPPYLHALAGMEAGNWMRAALSGLGAPSRLLPDLPGPVSALLAQGFALMPIAMVAAAIGFLSVERDLIDAAMLLGPGHRVFLRIVLPLAAPAIFAGSGAVFVFSLIDYSTPRDGDRRRIQRKPRAVAGGTDRAAPDRDHRAGDRRGAGDAFARRTGPCAHAGPGASTLSPARRAAPPGAPGPLARGRLRRDDPRAAARLGADLAAVARAGLGGAPRSRAHAGQCRARRGVGARPGGAGGGQSCCAAARTRVAGADLARRAVPARDPALAHRGGPSRAAGLLRARRPAQRRMAAGGW